jgi:hypothetical protein
MTAAESLAGHAPAATVVLAHGGGAPEAAMIGLPLLLFAVFFMLERRARKADAADADSDADDTTKGTT